MFVELFPFVVDHSIQDFIPCDALWMVRNYVDDFLDRYAVVVGNVSANAGDNELSSVSAIGTESERGRQVSHNFNLTFVFDSVKTEHRCRAESRTTNFLREVQLNVVMDVRLWECGQRFHSWAVGNDAEVYLFIAF